MSISAQLSAALDEQGALHLTGSFEAPLEARCQRCMDWMPLRVSGEIDLRVLAQDEPEPENLEHEYIHSSNGRVAVATLIEDELLLACPMIPVHADRSCGGTTPTPSGKSDQHKPFAALGDMMSNARKD